MTPKGGVMMNRRHFIKALMAAGVSVLSPVGLAAAGGMADYGNLLILVELKGGNDGLNTVVPYADPSYMSLRPRIAIPRDDVLQLTETAGFHPSLKPLLPLWQSRELALVQGIGYPAANLSHFRSIEIWDTASKSDEYLSDGWLARHFSAVPPAPTLAADAVIIGSQDRGPLSGGRRVVTLSNPDQFARQAERQPRRQIGHPGQGMAGSAQKSALAHIHGVEDDIRQAASQLIVRRGQTLQTVFPDGAFGNTVRIAAQVLASGGEGLAVPALRLTHGGYDTHQNQPGQHANLLRQLAEGLVALRAALVELGLWQRTVVMTYAEFGRRPKENQSNGTDHGTANVHFALGGRVRGGFYGAAPELGRLDGNGNIAHAVDFRSYYATALERLWQIDSRDALRGRFPAMDFLA